MKERDLKTCPFCGGRAKFCSRERLKSQMEKGFPVMPLILCEDINHCGAAAGPMLDEADYRGLSIDDVMANAVAAWNRRA